jgi:polyadenylate-binding protein
MNNQPLLGLALRIVHSSSNPKEQQVENANLLVKNLDKSVTQQDIFNLFKSFGNIISAKLETYPNSKESREFAYVQFQKEEEAEAAIKALNETEYKGKKLDVAKLAKKEKKKNEPTPAPVVKKNNLFVKNLPDGTTDEKLKDYGYVCFKEQAHADAAIKAMDKKTFNGKFLIVNYHISKKENELAGQGPRTIDPITQNLSQTFNSNIYVKFIPQGVTEEQLRKQFEFEDEDGKIVSIKLNQFKTQSDSDYKSQYAYILYKGTPGA